MSQADQDQIAPPGTEAEMTPQADHGEESYCGCDKLTGRVAVITGGDSGIGRAVAIAYAREGADILISYLNEQEDADARETARHVEAAGRRCVLVSGDISEAAHCRAIIDRAVAEFGRIDILVNNAAFQRTYESLDEISEEEWDRTFRTNIAAMFHLAKAAVPHMGLGSSIINTTSIQSDKPNPILLAYAATKGAVSNFTAGLAQMLGNKGIRVNAVAPGPIWTPLIPSTMPPEKVKNFGEDTPLGRVGQPSELAGIFVLLASDEGSYMNGGIYPVTGGKPLL
ncbi:glucose 1-dehydrogenase [Nitrobacter winogradskyi]|uniref:NAD(P)-dependent dehydrogenase (Short-subunit alcohol dehydrogenase family) n=2 Tax=Nitrobacter winogradskyi TaxID=913 RepID=A0ACC6AJR1_NITWI|nr:glucose 1-dehydrogenase [Nitrobacter winogradskyi]MCP1999777.1 NAD(P)-dependent dehydrogenase (short-subunit alcohol dehydrogenase family) [Nitrobacter winogradskyi]